MIIKKIEIKNFKSYYKDNTFDLINGFNLIIGINGGGKTCFYDALEWLFKTDDTNKMPIERISKKRIAELDINDSDDVRVAMTYEHGGNVKILEKMFHFTKLSGNEVRPTNYSFLLYENNEMGERIPREGFRFDYDFPTDIRQYTMFKGEKNLDVMQKNDALQQLVDTFGDVKDFEAYVKFMKYATDKADKASNDELKQDRRNTDSINRLNRTINLETEAISEIEEEISRKENEVDRFTGLLNRIEQSQESSEKLTAVNRKIEMLQQNRAEIQARIDENYTIKLLDDMWILMGFTDVAEEFSNKVSDVDRQRRKQENDYLIKLGEKKAINKMQSDFVPLPIHIPGPKIMQEMLDEEVCKICGRPAEKHSEAWEFMRQRLEEYKESLKTVEEEIVPYYKNNYVVELQKQDTTLNDNLSEITTLNDKINDTIEFNKRRHEEVKAIEAQLESEFEIKKRILAQSGGLSEEQLQANYNNIVSWVEQKKNAENRISTLKLQRAPHRTKLEDAKIELNKIAQNSDAAKYANTAHIFHLISDAFKTAKVTNKKRILQAIEDVSNDYLKILYAGGYRGTIKLLERANGQGEIILMNNDGTVASEPNTALETCYLMSVLFAIGQISSERRETEFPLLFDAPTSSLTEGKDSDFFNIIGTLNKQVIICTKSFVKKVKINGEDKEIIDLERANKVNGHIFGLSVKEPYDEEDQKTIETLITKIKE